MGNLAKDTTESDLWAFDDVDPMESDASPPPAPKPAESVIPAPRDGETVKSAQRKDASPAKTGGKLDRIKVNVGKPQIRAQTGTMAGMSKPGSDFDDLDHWDEPEAVAALPEVSPEIEIQPEPAAKPEPREIPATVDPQDEFSPPATAVRAPDAPRPRLNLTKIERIGLLALMVLLLVGGVVVFLGTISRLPTGVDPAMANDFPIQGKHLSILSAETHWRAPRSDDPVRRDTQLIPVVILASSGGPAAVRVFFRNSDGEFVGDAVTRRLQPGAKLEIAATAGFDDVGMHAGYRTGQSKPWTIEVLEATSENSPGTEFKRLFGLHVSPDRR